MQRIIVKNFGPLVDIDLDIKDFMVFIGPNASGKSTLTKLIYFFNAIPEFIEKSLEENFSESNISLPLGINSAFWNFHNFSFSPIFLKETYIKFYFSTSVFVELSGSHSSNSMFIPSFSTDLNNTFKQLETLRAFFKSKLPNNAIEYNVASKEFLDIRYDFKFEISKIINAAFFSFIEYEKIYIPEGRSAFNENNTPNTYINKGYSEYLSDTKYFFSSILETGIEDEIVNNVLKGKPFKTRGNQYSLRLENEFEVPFEFLSSGQKESFWLVLILKNLQQKIKAKQIIIEEPETHLFPDSQKTLIELITLIANQKNNKVIITTHSHYILGAINILLNAHRIGQIKPEAVKNIVPEELWIDNNGFFAGYLDNGIIKNIFDNEAEMLDISYLNKIAGELNQKFDELFEIEFEESDAK
jgi:ABC-type cobalamin/Fe3+-siderophores transport system ATPase subunit